MVITNYVNHRVQEVTPYGRRPSELIRLRVLDQDLSNEQKLQYDNEQTQFRNEVTTALFEPPLNPSLPTFSATNPYTHRVWEQLQASGATDEELTRFAHLQIGQAALLRPRPLELRQGRPAEIQHIESVIDNVIQNAQQVQQFQSWE